MNDILGVGFLLFVSVGRSPQVFVIQELTAKPLLHKEKGMLSFPLETLKPEDLGPERTINRLLVEEVGIPPSQVEICGITPERFNLIPGRNNIWTTYGYGLFLGDPNQDFHPEDDDIAFAGWMTLQALLSSRIRIEVRPVIEHLTRSVGYGKLLQRLSLAT